MQLPQISLFSLITSTPQRCNSVFAFLLVLIMVLGLFSKNSTAQMDATLYNMSTIPQFKYTNPASKCDYKLHIGIPIISSIYLDMRHNGFVFTDLVKKRADDSIYFDVDNAISKMKKMNYMGFAVQMDWLTVGWRKEKNQFFFNITEKAFLRFRYPKVFAQLLWEGNVQFIDETVDIKGLAIRATHYREYALGYARDVNDKLTLGGKLKYLYGIQNVSSKLTKMSLYTAPSTYELTGESDLVLNTSFIPDDGTPIGDYLFSKNKNRGIAIDLGATYKLSDKIELSASMIDLGFIKWSSNVTNYSNDLDGVTFKGNSINSFIDTNITSPFSTVIDSLVITFENAEETQKAYRDGLQTRFYLGGQYILNETNKVGALFHGEYFKRSFYPSFTLSYNYKIVKWIGASLSYSIMNRSYFNLGVGLSLNLGPVQLYAVSDNIMYLFNLARVNDDLLFPRKAKTAHLRTGLNLTFGLKDKDKDKDGIIDKEDECPDTPGPLEFNGCPDRDGDKIVDIHDDCPDDPGLQIYKGCPDRDEDKIIDKEDECPDTPGPPENKGCPVKLYLLDSNGDTLMSAELNDDGFFVFEKLPDAQTYVFRLNTEDIDMIQEVQILHTLNGIETILTATKTDEGFFIYQKLPIKETTLYLVGINGDTLMKAVRNEEGFFVFQPLPADKNYIFMMDASDKDLTDELLLLLIDAEGNEKIISAQQDGTNMFRYVYIPIAQDAQLELLEEDEVPVVLLEEEKEIVNTAFDNLEFNSGSDVISIGSYTSLEQLSKLLESKPDWRLKLSGHTDDVGSDKVNLILSKKRAESVKKVLVNRGIASGRIIVRYYGKSKPIASNATKEGQQKNRRVEMLILQGEDYEETDQSAAISTFENETGIWFRVQILASQTPLSENASDFKGVVGVQKYFDKGLNKYTVGKSSSLDSINKTVLPDMKKKGFPEAFVVAFKDGKRIPVNKAVKLLEE